eukprot:scaffold69566_cov28-Attheya_sp.AAC.1
MGWKYSIEFYVRDLNGENDGCEGQRVPFLFYTRNALVPTDVQFQSASQYCSKIIDPSLPVGKRWM